MSTQPQEGCCETSRPVASDEPTCVVDEVVHYRVTYMPRGRTSTLALDNATPPFAAKLAVLGLGNALAADRHGRMREPIYKAAADAQSRAFTPPEEALGI